MSHDSEIENQIEGHVYDGIVECDNPMPTWWIWTFLLSINFAFLYFIHYSISGAPTLKDELVVALAEIEALKAKAPVLDESEEVVGKAMQNKEIVELGGKAFSEKCAACHGQFLQGMIGPNLTDGYWLHGRGKPVDIVKVIRAGVLEKGMPAWGQILSKDEIYGLAAYIVSKKDSNPANPKAPQGELVQ